MKFSLRTKAALLAGALAALLLVLAGALQYRQLGEDLRARTQEQLDTLAESIAANLSANLETHAAVVEHAARTLDAPLLADRSRAQDFVSRVAATGTLFEGTTIIGSDGLVVVNHPPLPAGQVVDLSDRAYFRQAIEADRTVVSEPLLSRTGQGPAVVFAAPVRAPDGRTLAVLAARLELERPNALGGLAAAPLGRTGHFEVVTAPPDARYVVHPDPARLLRPAAAVPRGDLDIDYLQAARPLRLVPWSLRLALPRWEAEAPLLDARRRLLRDLAAFAAAAAVLAWLGMSWLLRPLGRLRDSMVRQRRQSDAHEAIDISSADERGDLARAFVELMRETRERQAEALAITERSPLGMFRAATDGRLTYVNDAYLQIRDLPREAAADGWLRHLPEAERDEAWRAWVAAVRRPEPFVQTRETRLADGSRRQVVVRTAPVVVDGEVVAHVGTVADITERLAQERALRVLTAIFETTPDYVVQTDRRGRVTYANPALRALAGLAADAPVAAIGFTDFLPVATRRRFDDEILPAVRAHGVWVGESEILDGAGRPVAVNHMVIGHRQADGEIEHYSGVMRNITEQLAARQAAESAGAALRAVAELTPAVLSVVDAQLCYRFVNSAFERRVGRPREAILGRPASEVLPAEDHAASLPHARRALAGETVEFERESRGADGPRVMAVSYLPIRLASGEVDGFVGMAQDITRHRQETRRLLDLSQADMLTGLLNRSGFTARLQALVDETPRERLALLYVDLDRFKPVNDTYGHAAGDEVLRIVGQRLKALVRPNDVVARLGGDEFALVLPDLPDEATARRIADKLARAVATPIAFGAQAVSVGASVGVVHGLRPGEGTDDFVVRADRLMFEVKGAGR